MFSFISTPIFPSLRPRPSATPYSLTVPGAITLVTVAKKSNNKSTSSSSSFSSSKNGLKKRNRNNHKNEWQQQNNTKSKSRKSRIHTVNKEKWDRVQPSHKDIKKVGELRPESCPALVLNADFSPLSYMPLSLWPWQDVVKAVFLDRVTVVATYDIGVRSPSMIFPLPSVVSLKQYQPMAVKKPAFTRFNVFMRDNFTCQYCGKRFATQELTFDHVVPRCNNGKTNWTNVVTACINCNHRKGRKMLSELKDMKLLKKPTEPSNMELQTNAKKFPPRYLHESWRDYIYWSQSMEEDEE